MKSIKYGEDYKAIKAPKNYPGKKYVDGRYCYEHHYIWWKNTGELIEKGENIHHINGNKRDNRFENLEKISINKHNDYHHKRGITYVELKCPICNTVFIRERRQTHLVIQKKATLCSRSCSSKWSHLTDNEQDEKLQENVLKIFKE